MTTPEHAALVEVLNAAQALLAAREDQTITRIEWERLQDAVDAAAAPADQARA